MLKSTMYNDPCKPPISCFDLSVDAKANVTHSYDRLRSSERLESYPEMQFS